MHLVGAGEGRPPDRLFAALHAACDLAAEDRVERAAAAQDRGGFEPERDDERLHGGGFLRSGAALRRGPGGPGGCGSPLDDRGARVGPFPKGFMMESPPPLNDRGTQGWMTNVDAGAHERAPAEPSSARRGQWSRLAGRRSRRPVKSPYQGGASTTV